MDNDFSASQSTKTGSSSGGSPFADIVALEESEKERVATELAAMDKEMADVDAEMQEQEEAATTQAKEDAKKDLRAYKEKELNTVLTNAKGDADKAAAGVTSKYEARKDEVVTKLVNNICNSTFHLSA